MTSWEHANDSVNIKLITLSADCTRFHLVQQLFIFNPVLYLAGLKKTQDLSIYLSVHKMPVNA